jgi:hypothetical protein
MIHTETNIKELKHIGHTHYIVKATIWNPEVIVLVHSLEYGKQLFMVRQQMVKELPWWKRIFVSKKLLPLFLTQDDLLQHRRYNAELRPIVIDNFFLS